jgi:hypothetical protein
MSEELTPLGTHSHDDATRAQDEVANEPIDVYAWWSRTVWQYAYMAPCTRCGRIHMHGGGNGDQPDLELNGEPGWWGSHCLNDSVQVPLRLVHFFPKPPATLPDVSGLSLTQRARVMARFVRERAWVPCPVCPPLDDGGPRYHKYHTFHERRLADCDICQPLPSGDPRQHQRSNRNARHYGAAK